MSCYIINTYTLLCNWNNVTSATTLQFRTIKLLEMRPVMNMAVGSMGAAKVKTLVFY